MSWRLYWRRNAPEYPDYQEVLRRRAEGLYNADRLSVVRKAQDNPSIKFLYEKWLKEANSEIAEHHLHTTITPSSN